MRKLDKLQMERLTYGAIACILVIIFGNIISQSEVIKSHIGISIVFVLMIIEDVLMSIVWIFALIGLFEGYGFLYNGTVPNWLKYSLFVNIISAGTCYMLRGTSIEIAETNSGEFFAGHSLFFLISALFLSVIIFLMINDIYEHNKD